MKPFYCQQTRRFTPVGAKYLILCIRRRNRYPFAPKPFFLSVPAVSIICVDFVQGCGVFRPRRPLVEQGHPAFEENAERPSVLACFVVSEIGTPWLFKSFFYAPFHRTYWCHFGALRSKGYGELGPRRPIAGRGDPAIEEHAHRSGLPVR